MLNNFDSFKQSFSGEIITPDHKEYEKARTVFLHTGSPEVIVRPKNAEDVVKALQFAKVNNLNLSVRSGGHSGAGFGTNDGGMVIDMTAINSVEVVDKDKHLVRIGAGALWGNVAQELQKHGLALSSGDTKTVGVGGLTLGGGIGWLVRKVGLTIDNLVSAQIVTADGKILHISATENQDLFWAIRGGGGNFGIATYFEFITYPLEQVYSGMMMFGLDDLSAVVTGWRDVMRSAPQELNSTLMVMPSFAGNPPGVMILVCYVGDEGAGKKAIEPFQKLGKVVHQDIKMKPYAELLEDAHAPQGMLIIAKDMFVQDFSDALITAIVDQCKVSIPILQIRYLKGTMNAVPTDATAFAHRNSEVLMVSPVFAQPNSTEAEISQALEPWEKLAKFGSGMYCGLLSLNTQAEVEGTYPQATYDRLAKIKKIYDPENVFRGNYNVKPE